MKTKLTPALVGSFVLGALILSVIGLISFGSARLFSKPGRFVSYFNESVQGLDLGSPVKLRGVRVGRVSSIHIRYDTHQRKSTVAVVCDLEHNLVTDSHGNLINLTDSQALQGLVDDGLRAKLRLTGITGLQVIELDFLDVKKYPAPMANDETGYPVMPAVPSEFTEFTDSAAELITRLKSVDFGGLSHALQHLVTNADAKITEMDLKGMVARMTAAADSIERLADGRETKAVVTNLNQTITEVRGLAARLDAQVDSLGNAARTSLHSLNQTSEAIQKTLGPESGLKEEATRTLQQLGEAASSVQRLADYLERNPNALVTGKKHPMK